MNHFRDKNSEENATKFLFIMQIYALYEITYLGISSELKNWVFFGNDQE